MQKYIKYNIPKTIIFCSWSLILKQPISIRQCKENAFQGDVLNVLDMTIRCDELGKKAKGCTEPWIKNMQGQL